jgi:hypothetical protein
MAEKVLTKLERSKRLARTLRKQDAVRAMLAEVEAEAEREFKAWAEGRVTNLSQARAELQSVGLI